MTLTFCSKFSMGMCENEAIAGNGSLNKKGSSHEVEDAMCLICVHNRTDRKSVQLIPKLVCVCCFFTQFIESMERS